MKWEYQLTRCIIYDVHDLSDPKIEKPSTSQSEHMQHVDEDPIPECVWWQENQHYEMPGGYGATPAQRLDALYEKLRADDQSPDVPSASALAKANISVSTHGRVKVKGKLVKGTRHGTGRRVTIDGKRMCVNKLTKRVWLRPPNTTDLKYELWSWEGEIE